MRSTHHSETASPACASARGWRPRRRARVAALCLASVATLAAAVPAARAQEAIPPGGAADAAGVPPAEQPGDATRAALDVAPVTAIGYALRAEGRLALGDTAGALADLDRAVALRPDLPHPWLARAAARLRAGDAPGTLADAEKALELFPPGHPEALWLRAGARADAGDAEGAKADYREVLRALLQGDAHRPDYDAFKEHWERGDIEAAAFAANCTLERVHGAAAGYFRYLRSYMLNALGEHRLAAADATWLIATTPERVIDGRIRRAYARSAVGDREGALADFEAVLERSGGGNTSALVGRAFARLDGGDHEGARLDFEEALRRGSASTSARAGLAFAALARGDEAAARHAFEDVVRASAASSASTYRATALLALGRPDQAVMALNAAIANRPSTYALTLLAMVHAAQGRRAQAEPLFQRAGRMAPRRGLAGILLAALYGVDDHLPAACAADDPWIAALARFVAGDLPLEGLLAEADSAPSAFARRERRCDAHAYAGLVAERDGRAADARTHYEAAIGTGIIYFGEHYLARLRLEALEDPASQAAPDD